MSISYVWNPITIFSYPDFFPTRNSNLDGAISEENLVTLNNEHVFRRLDCFTYCNTRSSHWGYSKNRFSADHAFRTRLNSYMVTALKINNGFKPLTPFAKRTPNLDVSLGSEYATAFRQNPCRRSVEPFTFTKVANLRSELHWKVCFFLRGFSSLQSKAIFCYFLSQPNIYLFKVNNRNTRARCKICLKLTIKTQENVIDCSVMSSCQMTSSGCFFCWFVSFEHISPLVLVFLLLSLNRSLPVGWCYEEPYFSVGFQIVASGLYNSVFVSM